MEDDMPEIEWYAYGFGAGEVDAHEGVRQRPPRGEAETAYWRGYADGVRSMKIKRREEIAYMEDMVRRAYGGSR